METVREYSKNAMKRAMKKTKYMMLRKYREKTEYCCQSESAQEAAISERIVNASTRSSHMNVRFLRIGSRFCRMKKQRKTRWMIRAEMMKSKL